MLIVKVNYSIDSLFLSEPQLLSVAKWIYNGMIERKDAGINLSLAINIVAIIAYTLKERK